MGSIVRLTVKTLFGVVASAIITLPVLAGSDLKVAPLRNGIAVPSRDFQFGQTGGGPYGKWAVVRDVEAKQGAALEDAINKIGPVLNGLDGRKSGTAAGYNYFDAKNSRIVWCEATSRKYIQNPAV